MLQYTKLSYRTRSACGNKRPGLTPRSERRTRCLAASIPRNLSSRLLKQKSGVRSWGTKGSTRCRTWGGCGAWIAFAQWVAACSALHLQRSLLRQDTSASIVARERKQHYWRAYLLQKDQRRRSWCMCSSLKRLLGQDLLAISAIIATAILPKQLRQILEWCTSSEKYVACSLYRSESPLGKNVAPAKLTEEQVRAIRACLLEGMSD